MNNSSNNSPLWSTPPLTHSSAIPDNSSGPSHSDVIASIAHTYQRYSTYQAKNSSPIYEKLSNAIAHDPEILTLLAQLPTRCQQPNLLFGAYRFLGHSTYSYAHFRTIIIDQWDRVSHILLCYRTQTNEVARCSALIPVLALLDQPLALLEIGTLATACLQLDKYHYTYCYDDGTQKTIGPDSQVEIVCHSSANTPIPNGIPTISYRAGLDICPLNPADQRVRMWLESLIWPEHTRRRLRLHHALEIATQNPVPTLTADAITGLDELVGTVPEGLTIVIFHSATIGYLSAQQRAKFYQSIPQQSGHWISYEPWGCFPDIDAQLPLSHSDFHASTPQPFIVSLDAHPIALAGPHGQSLQWL